MVLPEEPSGFRLKGELLLEAATLGDLFDGVMLVATVPKYREWAYAELLKSISPLTLIGVE